MKRLIPLIMTIGIAVLAGYYFAQHKKNNLILKLISSTSVSDQLLGISLLQSASFDEVHEILSPIIETESDASDKAQQLIVSKAFQEERVSELKHVNIDAELFEAAIWWSQRSGSTDVELEIEFPPSPWIKKLLALHPFHDQSPSYEEIVELPVRDRDGSVVLTVLAIYQTAPQNIENLVLEWDADIDLEKRKAALLLRALMSLPLPESSSEIESLHTIGVILQDEDFQLAWRAMHREDGTIDPDVALAALIIDKERFIPELIQSAKQQLWTLPEHPIVLAKTFSSSIADQIPFEFLENKETRKKWWSLYACGLLQEE